MYLEQERGQKNKQFYRESIEEGNDVKARQVHCQHLSSYCYTTTSTMKEASWSSDSMYARSFSAVLSSLHTHNVWKSQKSLIQYCERSELHLNSECKFWTKNTKNGQFGKFLKMRHLDDFQTLCIQSPFYVRLISLYAALLWDFWPSHRDWRPEEKKICSRQLHWGQEDPQEF